MKRYQGNDKVGAGIYFNYRELAFRSLIDDGRLPGGPEQVWLRVPSVLMLVVAPLVGLAYVMFLPLIGFLMLGGLLAKKVYAYLGEHLLPALRAGGRVLRPVWQPAMAFLGRGRTARGEPAAAKAKDEWAEDVRRELAEPAEEDEK